MEAITSSEGRLRFKEYERPKPSSSQCLVRVTFSGVNRADLLQVKGLYPPPLGASEILGLEFSGIVEEVGDKVNGFKPGDRVCAIVASGGYAPFVCVEASQLMKVPEKLSLQEAGAIPEVFITSFQSLVHIAKLQENEKVLIHAGASGVGSAAIQMAKALGCFVICTASLGKHSHCYRLGADRCIDYKSEDFGEEVSSIDMVLDLIGGSYFGKNIKVLGLQGRMVMLGFLGGVRASDTNVAGIVTKRLKIEGSTLRARDKVYKANLTRDFVRQYFSDKEFPFETSIDKVFSSREVEDAHIYMRTNQNKGKILLEW